METVNPQLENGYIKIANEIWDEVIRRDFSKRQKDILLFIWRLSYGCRKKRALIPMLKDFALCGVGPNHINSELSYLIECKVLIWHKGSNEFEIEKRYDLWQVSPVRYWNEDHFRGLVHQNITSQTGKLDESDFPKQEVSASQNGKLNDGYFPKQEVDTSQNGKLDQGQLPKTGSDDFPKRELRMTENPSAATAEVGSKDSITDIITIIPTITDSKDSFRILQDAYCSLHGKLEFDVSAIETMKMQKIIDKGIPVDFIIRCMHDLFEKKRAREGDSFQKPGAFGYYELATQNAWKRESQKQKAGEGTDDSKDGAGRGENHSAGTGQTSLTARFTKTT